MSDGSMMVVELIERVPDAEVAIVAARVTERLAGQQIGIEAERVRKLLDGRVGPITRALPPEKADWIADVFETVGVRVRVRQARPDEAAAGEAAAQSVPSIRPAAAKAPVADGDVPRAGPTETGATGSPSATGSADAEEASPGGNAVDANATDVRVPEAESVEVDATGVDGARIDATGVDGAAIDGADEGTPPARAPVIDAAGHPTDAQAAGIDDTDHAPDALETPDGDALETPDAAAPEQGPDVDGRDPLTAPAAREPSRPMVGQGWDVEPAAAWTTWRTGVAAHAPRDDPPRASTANVTAPHVAPPVLPEDEAAGGGPFGIPESPSRAGAGDAGAAARYVTMRRQAEAERAGRRDGERREGERRSSSDGTSPRPTEGGLTARRRGLLIALAILTTVFIALQWWVRA